MRRYVALRPSGMSPTLMNRMVSAPSVAGMPPGGNPCARRAIFSVQLRSQRGPSELLPVDVQGGVGGMGDVVAKRLIGVGTTVGARHGCCFEDFALLAGGCDSCGGSADGDDWCIEEAGINGWGDGAVGMARRGRGQRPLCSC
jgi:hypothetical protein